MNRGEVRESHPKKMSISTSECYNPMAVGATLCHLRVEKEKLDWTDFPETAGGVHGRAAVGPARRCEG